MKHRSGVVAGFVVASFFVFGNAIGAADKPGQAAIASLRASSALPEFSALADSAARARDSLTAAARACASASRFCVSARLLCS